MGLELINTLIANKMHRIRQYGYNDIIHDDHNSSNKLYYIKKGVVSINQIDEKGEKRIVLLLGPLEYFGLKSILHSYSGKPLSSTSKSDLTIIYEFHKSTINKYLEGEELLNEDIKHILLQRMQLLEKRIEILTKPKIQNRLYLSLLELEDRLEGKLSTEVNAKSKIHLLLSQSEWGCYCRGTRENLCKAFRKLIK